MSWRVVLVASNAKLDYKLDYLVIRTVDEVKRIHLSEIGVLVVESTAVSLTSYLLCELIQHKIKVIFCDHNRDPCSELVPTCGSHDSSARIHRQIGWQQSVQQRVWTEIVRQKLRCQRSHLRHRGLAQAETITTYLEQLQWNDATNREGHAAKAYFRALFGLEISIKFKIKKRVYPYLKIRIYSFLFTFILFYCISSLILMCAVRLFFLLIYLIFSLCLLRP